MRAAKGMKSRFNCLFVCLRRDSTERKYLGIMRLINSNYNHYWCTTRSGEVYSGGGGGGRREEGGGRREEWGGGEETTRCLINRAL